MRHHRNDDGQLTARRIFANDSLRWMFGAPTMDGFLERPVLDSWVEVSALQKVNESFSERSPLVGFEAERVNWDGHKFWVSMTGQSVALGGEDLTIVWHLDITDRVLAERNLKEREGQLEDFMDSSIDWFWEMDADLRFTHMSSNVERLLGVEPEWHYGKTRQELLGPGYDRSVWDLHFQALNAHRPFRDFVYQRVGEGVEHKWLSTSGKPVVAPDGAFLGYRGTGTDVTERMENQELRIASCAKSEFLSSMSHELRTPLNANLGFGGMLERDIDQPLTANQQVAVGQIRAGGSHLLELINQVLDLAKIESQTLDLSIEPVDTDAVLEECLGLAAPWLRRSVFQFNSIKLIKLIKGEFPV